MIWSIILILMLTMKIVELAATWRRFRGLRGRRRPATTATAVLSASLCYSVNVGGPMTRPTVWRLFKAQTLERGTCFAYSSTRIKAAPGRVPDGGWPARRDSSSTPLFSNLYFGIKNSKWIGFWLEPVAPDEDVIYPGSAESFHHRALCHLWKQDRIRNSNAFFGTCNSQAPHNTELPRQATASVSTSVETAELRHTTRISTTTPHTFPTVTRHSATANA